MNEEVDIAQAEEQAMRDEIASEVYNDEDVEVTPTGEGHQGEPEATERVGSEEGEREAAVVDSEGEGEASEQAQGQQPDPLDALRQEVLGLKNSVETIPHRLKQVESRVGSIQNEFYAAKKAAEKANDAPTEKEMAQAALDQKKWDALKEEYPEWSDILDELPKMFKPGESVDKEALRNELKEELKKELFSTAGQSKKKGNLNDELLAISLVHRDWRKDVKTPEWQEYLNTLAPEDRGGVLKSNSSNVVIAALTGFKEYRAEKAASSSAGGNADNKEKAAQIAQQRAQRVERSTAAHSPQSSKKIPRPKAEKDMTEAELRAKIAAEVFDDD